MTDTQKELKRKFLEQEDYSKKSTIASDHKHEEYIKTTLNTTIQKMNDMFAAQQNQIAKIQSQVAPIGDQIKDVRHLKEQIENMKHEQDRFSKKLYKHFKIENTNNRHDD